MTKIEHVNRIFRVWATPDGRLPYRAYDNDLPPSHKYVVKNFNNVCVLLNAQIKEQADAGYLAEE